MNGRGLGRGLGRNGTIRSALALLVAGLVPLAACARSPRPPDSPAVEAADTVGDIVVPDPFRWLEESGSERVAEWVAAQNAWTDAFVGGSARRMDILRRIVELVRVDVVTQPIARGDRYFFMRRAADNPHASIFVRNGSDGVDRRLIDPQAFSDSVPPDLALLSVTPEGGVITYSVQRRGSQESEIRFFDVERRVDMAGRLPPARYSGAEMDADRNGVWFIRADDDGPRLYHRFLAGPAAAGGDSLVFGAQLGPDAALGSAVSANGRWLGIVVFHGEAVPATDVYFADLEGDGRVRPLVEGIEATFLPTFAGDTILLQTDWNAPNGRVLRVSLDDPRRERWVEIVPERSDATVEGVTAVGGHVLVNSVSDAYSHLDAYGMDGTHLGEIELPYPGSIAAITGGWESHEAFFTWTTFHVPSTIQRYDARTRSVDAWFEPPVAIPAGITVRLDTALSADGTRVPVFLVHRDGVPMDGRNPAILTAFGGFGADMSPGFTVESVILAETGGVFAVAITRGGGEFGEVWHEAAMRERKPRAIDDFIAAAEWLIERDYTSARRLAAIGTTHGGMLVTAAMTRRPELFAAIGAQFPLLDMARFDEGVTGGDWIEEYGSPSEPAALRALLSYSPYHTVDTAAAVPPVLMVAAASSPVPPFHARKMIARLQTQHGPATPWLLREDTLPAGTIGPRFAPVENLADLLSFVLAVIARPPAPGPVS
jgi:prolyl oligopeptidase